MNEWSAGMKQGPNNESHALERLSALADGEVERAAVADLCAAWREQQSARASWHAWHLIGDVLRSEDLSSDARHDAAFLVALRARLTSEALALAPRAAPAVGGGTGLRFASPRRGVGWSRFAAPAAVAAGFVAVASVLLSIQAPSPQSANGTLAIAPEASVRAVASPAPLAAEPQVTVASGKLIRDARLDRYLAAHKQFGGSTALGVPSGFLRSATVEVPSR